MAVCIAMTHTATRDVLEKLNLQPKTARHIVEIARVYQIFYNRID
jgi:hypothetical protein